jgi:ABC-2 type transport system permease protein
MTTDVTTADARAPARVGLTQSRIFLSEWTKLRSVRSTRWSLLAAFVFTIGIAALATAVLRNHWSGMSPADRAEFQPLDLNLAGVQLAQLAIGVLGVLVISAEYSTGMIRSSMSAVPRRLPVLWGKAGVYGLTTLVLMVPAALLAFLIGQGILSGGHLPHLGLGDPRVARAVIGAGLYLTVVGLFGLGIGAIVRNTAGGIATFAAIMFVLPPLMNVLPSSWNTAASPYLPLAAGQSVMAISGTDHLAPWTGLGLFCAYTALALAVAAVLLRRRDV